jgi:hypothetical protein
MKSYAENGLSLEWDAPEMVMGSTPVRVIVKAMPANPSNVVRARWSASGMPEMETRGFPLDRGDANGQRFALDLPSPAIGHSITWRPVLSCSGREADPGRQGMVESLTRTRPEDDGEAQLREPALPAARFPYALDFLARVTAPLERHPAPIGKTPDGLRILFPIGAGGTVEGPRFRGRIAHRGGDWMRVREDGIGVTDIHALIETEDGATILSEYSGFADFGPDGFTQLAAGGGPSRADLNLTPRYLTAAEPWRWLNRLQCVGFGRVTMATLLVEYDLYAMRSHAAETS